MREKNLCALVPDDYDDDDHDACAKASFNLITQIISCSETRGGKTVYSLHQWKDKTLLFTSGAKALKSVTF